MIGYFWQHKNCVSRAPEKNYLKIDELTLENTEGAITNWQSREIG
jgi:hypothetical protein